MTHDIWLNGLNHNDIRHYFGDTIECSDMPYFGRQSRFFPFFESIIDNIIPTCNRKIYSETNSGSVSNAHKFAIKGYKTITNDLGYYSYCISNAINGNEDSINQASYCATLIDTQRTYIPEYINSMDINKDIYNKYISHLVACSKTGKFYKSYNMDLYGFLASMEPVGIIFMDFAWPWRYRTEQDGSTEEYTASVDLFRKYLTGEQLNFTAWNRKEVISRCLEAVTLAQKTSEWVLLSNQSSNYPDPDTLEIELLNNGISFERYTMTTRAENEDDLSNDVLGGYFREYVYKIRGLL